MLVSSMKISRTVFFLLVCTSLSIIFPITVKGDHRLNIVAKEDDWYKKKLNASRQMTLEAYLPDPFKEVTEFNHHVQKAFENDVHNNITYLENEEEDDGDHYIITDGSNNNTRRSLRGKKYTGKCMAVNPIDRCWRCKSNWAKDRKLLAKCARGFGRRTTGGLKGKYYIVTDSSDNDLVNPKPGTLRHAVLQPEPLWIIFARSMRIKLNAELIVTNDKTIDGRGAQVHLADGAGIMIQFARNVIIHNIKIHDMQPQKGGNMRDSWNHVGIRNADDGDGISIFSSQDVWIDHLSMWNCKDGLIDAVEGSTGITISNCHFTRHNDVMLFGANDQHTIDEKMQITLAFNHFGKGLIQRMPRCRFGFFHVVNNDYTHWIMYAIGGTAHPTIISQGNRFIAPNDPNAKQVTNRNNIHDESWANWIWRSDDDVFLNGAYFVESGENKNAYSGKDFIKSKPGTFVKRLTRFAGYLECKVGKPC